jgi:hypothetical protein
MRQLKIDLGWAVISGLAATAAMGAFAIGAAEYAAAGAMGWAAIESACAAGCLAGAGLCVREAMIAATALWEMRLTPDILRNGKWRKGWKHTSPI